MLTPCWCKPIFSFFYQKFFGKINFGHKKNVHFPFLQNTFENLYKNTFYYIYVDEMEVKICILLYYMCKQPDFFVVLYKKDEKNSFHG